MKHPYAFTVYLAFLWIIDLKLTWIHLCICTLPSLFLSTMKLLRMLKFCTKWSGSRSIDWQLLSLFCGYICYIHVLLWISYIILERKIFYQSNWKRIPINTSMIPRAMHVDQITGPVINFNFQTDPCSIMFKIPQKLKVRR